MSDEKKIGAYICTGCGLGERLDAGQLEMIATREGKTRYAKQHNFLCNREGVAMIQADIDAGEANRIMIAGCSRRAKTEAFRFDNVAITRANLREGVIWSQPDSAEAKGGTQEMANDYIRVACIEAKFMAAPEPSGEQALNKPM